MDIFTYVLVSKWLIFFWESYLFYRQRKVCKTTREVPDELKSVIDQDKFEQLRHISLDLILFQFLINFISTIASTLFLWRNGTWMFWIWSGYLMEYIGLGKGNALAQSVIFFMKYYLVLRTFYLPQMIYQDFTINKHDNTEKRRLNSLLREYTKESLLFLPLFVFVVPSVLYFYKWTALMWHCTFSTNMVVCLILVASQVGRHILLFVDVIYKTIQLDKYPPMQDRELKSRFQKLASSAGFPLKSICIAKGPFPQPILNQSKGIAWVFRFLTRKNIVSDSRSQTDLENGVTEFGCKYTQENFPRIRWYADMFEAIVVRKLFRGKLSHTPEEVAINVTVGMFLFPFGLLLMGQQTIFSPFGLVTEQPIIIKFLTVYFDIFWPVIKVVFFTANTISRHHETKADEFVAGELRNHNGLKMALIKSCEDDFPVDDWLFSSWHRCFPSLLDRLKAVEKVKNKFA